MEKFLWPVHSARGQMLACYERIRLRRYADAFRDLAYHILNRGPSEALQVGEQECGEAAVRICEHIGVESIRHLGERMRDAADLFDAVSAEQCSFEAPELLLRRGIEIRLKKAGFELYDILVVGKNHGRREYLLSVRSTNGRLLEAEAAAKILSECFREKIVPSMCCPLFVSAEFNEYLFCSAGRFAILEGQACACKAGETCSGDSYSFWQQGGRYVCMLSDGTGAGETARRDSGQLLDLAENYLESGFEGNQMLGFLEGCLLNHFLQGRVPSLDYLEIDQATGKMKMAKFGSAVTFLWHEGRLSLLEPENLPLGYEKLSEVKWREEVLAPSDSLILMSDGAAERVAGLLLEPDFAHRLESGERSSPNILAREILELAVELDEGKPRDDMTVLVLQITNG